MEAPMTSTPDIDLLRAWYDTRDAEAFKELTRRYAGLVHAAARRILGNDAEAEDVTQESFERMAIATRPPKAPIAPWLHRVATNRALDRLRTERHRRQRERRYVDAHGPKTEAIAWDDVYVYVDEAINALPEKLRVPMIEHFYRDRSGADIAAELGLTRQAVSYRIRQGVERVRRTLRERGIPVASASLAAWMGAGLAEAATLPASLTSTLGQLAVAGVTGSSVGVATVAATALGGVLVMKKVIAVAVVVVVALLGMWGVSQLDGPVAEPAPPSYVPKSEALKPVAAVAAAESEAAPAEDDPAIGPAAASDPSTGDITGRIYNTVTGEGIAGAFPEVYIADNEAIADRAIKVSGDKSDASGIYRLAGLTPGAYALRAPQLDAYPQLREDYLPALGAQFVTVATQRGGAQRRFRTRSRRPRPRHGALGGW